MRNTTQRHANVRITGSVRELLRMIQTTHGTHSDLGRKASTILTSGQRQMPERTLKTFVNAVGM